MVRLCQLKVRMRCILKALVTVELQLRSDFFFAFGCANGTKHKIEATPHEDEAVEKFTKK